MAISYDQIMSLDSVGNVFSYREQETMLYALGVGMGRDPLNESELGFVFERETLKTIPSMATVNSAGAAAQGLRL